MSEERKRNLRTQGRFSGNASKNIRGNAHQRRSDGIANYNLSANQSTNTSNLPTQTNLQNSASSLVYKKTEMSDISNVKEKTKDCNVLSSNQFNKWVQLDPTAETISEIFYNPQALTKVESDQYFSRFAYGGIIPWEEVKFTTDRGDVIVPRLVCWFGPFSYAYSKMQHKSNMNWPQELLDVKNRVEALLRDQGRPVIFNSVLLNLYRTCHDGVAWHSDNELSMGVKPTIASISLGETRKFELKRKEVIENELAEWRIHLTSGSLLVMDSNVQEDWKHRVPKEYHDREARVNLTFRTVYEIPNANPRRTI